MYEDIEHSYDVFKENFVDSELLCFLINNTKIENNIHQNEMKYITLTNYLNFFSVDNKEQDIIKEIKLSLMNEDLKDLIYQLNTYFDKLNLRKLMIRDFLKEDE